MARKPNPIDLAAAHWAVRQAESLSEAEQASFQAWIDADPRHRGAYLRLSAVQSDLPRLTALSAGRHTGIAPSRSEDSRFPLGLRLPRSRVALLGGMAASAALLLIVGARWIPAHFGGDHYVSRIGEIRQVALEDGSRMTLDTDSETRVRYSDTTRQVTLARGEALFDVAKDPARQFVVRAGHDTIRALGTSFVVKMTDAGTRVTVTEGVVEVTQDRAALGSRGALDEKRIRLAANQSLIPESRGRSLVQRVDHADVERELAWRQGMVAFNGESLARAAAEINRHNRRHIVIEDPALAARPVVGMFRADDIHAFAQTAAAVTGGELVEEGDTLRLRRPETH